VPETWKSKRRRSGLLLHADEASEALRVEREREEERAVVVWRV